jgi:hypothetical protein
VLAQHDYARKGANEGRCRKERGLSCHADESHRMDEDHARAVADEAEHRAEHEGLGARHQELRRGGAESEQECGAKRRCHPAQGSRRWGRAGDPRCHPAKVGASASREDKRIHPVLRARR